MTVSGYAVQDQPDMQSILSLCRADLEGAHSKIRQIQHTVDSVRSVQTIHGSRLDALETRQEESAGQIRELHRSLIELRGEVSTLTASVANASGMIGEIKRQAGATHALVQEHATTDALSLERISRRLSLLLVVCTVIGAAIGLATGDFLGSESVSKILSVLLGAP